MAIKREKENYTIQSVSHALDILESFTKTEDELGVTGCRSGWDCTRTTCSACLPRLSTGATSSRTS